MAISDWASNTGGQIMPKPPGATNALGSKRIVEYYDPITGATTGEVRHEVYLYNNSGGATAVGTPYFAVINASAIATAYQAIAMAASTPKMEIVVAVEAIASGAYGWFAFSGPVNTTLNAAVTANHFVKTTVGTNAAALFSDGASKTANSVGRMGLRAGVGAAPTSSEPNKVYLFGSDQTIA